MIAPLTFLLGLRRHLGDPVSRPTQELPHRRERQDLGRLILPPGWSVREIEVEPGEPYTAILDDGWERGFLLRILPELPGVFDLKALHDEARRHFADLAIVWSRTMRVQHKSSWRNGVFVLEGPPSALAGELIELSHALAPVRGA